MIVNTLAFLLGVLLLQQQATLPSLWLLGVLLVLLLLGRIPFRWCGYPALFVAGLFWATLQATGLMQAQLPTELQGQDIIVQGVVVSLPRADAKRVRFNFLIDPGSSGDGQRVSGKVWLNWYAKQLPDLAIGQRWQLQLRLKRPHGLHNPGSFDYQGWLFREGVIATGYVRHSAENLLLGDAGGWHHFQRWREGIGQRIDQVVGNRQTAALIRALVIGDRSRIGDDQWEIFRRTGTNHLMAISGLHIGIIAGLLYFLGQRLWRLSSCACHWLPAPQAGALSALLGALFYSALAGFSISCIRALIMLAVVMFGLMMRRKVLPGQGLAVALWLVLLWDSMAVLSAGFWLSFGAVAVILYGVSGRLGQGRNRMLDLVRVQWMVSIGLAPLLLIWGLGVSSVSPLVNLIAVPLFSLLLVPLVLVATLLALFVPTLGAPLLAWVGNGLEWVQAVLAWTAGQSGLFSVAGSVPGWLVLAAAIGIALLLMPRGLPGRWLGGVMLLPLLLFTPPRPQADELWLTMLDVGQGLSLLLQTKDHSLLYDTGPRFPGGFDTAKAVVVPYLKHLGITRLDKLILSNGDMDHSGGFQTLQRAMPIDDLLSGEPHRIPSGQVVPCLAGQSWRWDGVIFTILHPKPEARWQGNNSSCVLRVATQAGAVLITGDIERQVEHQLVIQQFEQLKADLVVVPHHGSGTSSTTDFINAVGATHGLVSAGFLNRFGFPRGEVVERWHQAGVKLFNTADAGAITLKMGAGEPADPPSGYRQQAKRYWMAP